MRKEKKLGMDNCQEEFIKSERVKILNEIQESYKNERLIPFIGAGFSENIEGYPGWDDFVRRLSRKLDETPNFLQKLIHGNNLQAVEYFMIRMLIKKNRMNQKDWYDISKGFVRDELNELFSKKKFKESTWQAQIALVNLKNFSLIYTTNWDDTLEKTCDKILGEGRCNLYYTIAQLETLKKEYLENTARDAQKRKKLIIKLHGHYSEDKTIIASEYDYYHRINTFNALDVIFQNDLLLNDFLFLGFSFNDVNINYLLYQIDYMRKSVRPTNKLYLLSILKPDYYYYKLYKEHKETIVYYLFENSSKYDEFSKKAKAEKRKILRNKIVKFLNEISNGELKTIKQLKGILEEK